MSVETHDFVLPEEITKVTATSPRDLVVISQPKMGKGCILGDFSVKYNALVLDLERGGYEYIAARKLSIYPTQETTDWEAYENYINIRNLLLEKKGKYKFLIIDGLSDLDRMSEMGGTKLYMDTIIGKNFNKVSKTSTEKYHPTDPEFKSVLTLPEGAGYQYTRKWFMDQISIFSQISPYRLYAAHIIDKYIKENGKEEVIGNEIALTGQLKRIFSSKVTSLAKLIADGNKRILNFDVANDSILAGSRAPFLKGRIDISELKNDKIVTFWENIYSEECLTK